MIDYEILKDAIEGLRTPSKLDTQPLIDALFVQQFLKRHPAYEGLTPGRRLGLILADLWREHFYPGEMTAKLKRQWDRFLVLEAGYFYPFRMKQILPEGQPQIGTVLGSPERIAEIIANGHAAKSPELLDVRHNEFWAAICREPLRPDKQSAAEVIAPTTVASRQKVAIQKFAEFLNGLGDESAAVATPTPTPTETASTATPDVVVIEPPVTNPATSIVEVTEETPPIDPSARLDAYLDHVLPPTPIYIPDEWLPIIGLAEFNRRAIIQGEIGSGKTELMHALAVNLKQAGLVPLYVSIAQYAPHAASMDVVKFFATHGLFGQSYLSEAEREDFAVATGEAARSDRLVILADQCDDLLEAEWPIVSQRLSSIPNLIVAERNPRLMIDRTAIMVISMLKLSERSLIGLLKATGTTTDSAEKVLADARRSHLDLTPALALLAAQLAHTSVEVPSVVLIGAWLDRVLKATRSSGQVVAEIDQARRLLRYLAAIQFEIAPRPEPTTDLVRENVRRAFWTLPLQMEEEKLGWLLMGFCVRSGLLIDAGERWQIVNPQIALALAAEFAADQKGWVSLRPQHRQLMIWTATLIARRDADRQAVFLNALRQSLANFTTLSFLDAADVAAEFSRATSHIAQEFTTDAVRWLKELERVDSYAIHHAVSQRAYRLGTIRTITLTPPEPLVPAKELERYAYDLAGLLDRLNISRPDGDESGWLDDRAVQKGLVGSLARGLPPELLLRSAAWLRRSSLSKIVEFEARLATPWNSRRRSALEMLALLARDPHQDATINRLAKSVLAKDDFILRLWNASNEYTPLVLELLLAVDKRLYKQLVSLDATEWRIID